MSGVTDIGRANKINELHEQIKTSARKTIEAVIIIGNMLTETKAELNHGEFNNWCKENLNLSRTTIFRYMSIAQNPNNIELAKTPTEALNLISKSSNKKHFKNGIYLKNIYGAILTIYVKDGYIGYVQFLGSSYQSMRSIEINTYLDIAKKKSLPLPDKTFLFIAEKKDSVEFQKYFSNVPNEWFFCQPNGWLEKHLSLLTLFAPEEYQILIN